MIHNFINPFMEKIELQPVEFKTHYLYNLTAIRFQIKQTRPSSGDVIPFYLHEDKETGTVFYNLFAIRLLSIYLNEIICLISSMSQDGFL